MALKPRPEKVMAGVGIALGVLGALALMPRARNTAITQVALAAARPPEWMRAAYSRPDGQLEPRIQEVLAAHPGNVTLHVGAATLRGFVPVDEGDHVEEAAARRRESTHRILSELQRVADRFPDSAAVRAHQLRIMCAEAVVIRRVEERQVDRHAARPNASTRAAKPSPAALRTFRAVAAAGQRLEPRNGFFDTMLAAAAFASNRDQEGLQHLHRAAAKPDWNDYFWQERPAQWALLERAYGERGWLQKLPAGLNAFEGQAHFRAVQSVANLALWHSWQAQKSGHPDRVRAIRRDVMQLGLRLQSRPEVLRLGVVLFDAGSHRVPKDTGPWYILDHQKLREHLLSPYLTYLKRHGEAEEIEWVRAGSRKTEAGWSRVNEEDQTNSARPHWADMWLGVGWATGLVLVKQVAGLLLFWAGTLLLGRTVRPRGGSTVAGRGATLLAYALVFLAPVVVVSAIGSDHPWPGTLEAGITAFALVLLGAAWLSFRLRDRRERSGVELAAGAWIALFLTAALAPLFLIAIHGPISLMWGYLGGVVLVGLVAARASKRGSGTGAPRPEGRPWLTAAVAVVGTAFCLALAMPLLLRPDSLMRVLQVYPLSGPTDGPAGLVPLVMVIPAALLVFLQLCRVAALGLPLIDGVLRGLRYTTPRTIALLAALYLATLAPTVAAERVLERQLSRSIAGEAL